MAGCSVPRGIALPRDDERGSVRSEVEEELGDYIQRKHCVGVESVICEADDAEYGGQDEEAE